MVVDTVIQLCLSLEGNAFQVLTLDLGDHSSPVVVSTEAKMAEHIFNYGALKKHVRLVQTSRWRLEPCSTSQRLGKVWRGSREWQSQGGALRLPGNEACVYCKGNHWHKRS
ncbi:hypothetical protein SRHO_G00031310 [Serrasalmus rhombeus]